MTNKKGRHAKKQCKKGGLKAKWQAQQAAKARLQKEKVENKPNQISVPRRLPQVNNIYKRDRRIAICMGLVRKFLRKFSITYFG